MREQPVLIHASFHKCLTVLFRRVMARTMHGVLPGAAGGYVHLNSRIDELPTALRDHRVVSVNNHLVDVAPLGPDARISRFVRDPRDLLVSGYHYHRRGAEAWSTVVDPQPADWAVVNGQIPADLPAGSSFSSYLQSVSVEQGLLAELEFRRRHFDALAGWPDDDRILVQRYEDILGHEVETFDRIFAHLGIGGIRRRIGLRAAANLAVGSAPPTSAHIRDPRPGQWQDFLPATVVAELDRRHPGAVERYGYPASSTFS